MRDGARRCSKCGYQWFAQKVAKPRKIRTAGGSWSLAGREGMAASAGARAGARYQTDVMRYERWRLCARCGSSEVKSVATKGFVPTAATEAVAGSAAPGATAPSAGVDASAAPPGPTAAEPRAGHQREHEPSVGAQESKGSSPQDGPSLIVKIVGSVVAIGVIVLIGPVLTVLGSEAKRRAGESLTALPQSEDGRRRAWWTVAGAVGTVMLLSLMVQQLVWAIGGGAPADGSPGVGALLGAVVGALLVGGVWQAAQRGLFRSLPLPKALAAPLTETRD